MAIDILFIIMATFGFYFGFTFGMMKVGLMVLSLLFAVLAAMAFTPMTTNLIIDTFNVESVFLPFVAFLVTLLVVLMMARIMTKLVEESVDNKKFDMISQVLGGVVMAIVFTLLYSVLVTFFGQAGVIKLVLNREVMVTRADQDVKLIVLGKVIRPDTLVMVIDEHERPYKFTETEDDKGSSLEFGSDPRGGNRYQAYISSNVQEWAILPGDTVSIKSTEQKFLMADNKMICFCNTEFLIEAQNDSIFFQCQDRLVEAKSMTSFFYKYIEIIPRRGTQVMEGMAPFVDQFISYMSIALEKLDKGDLHPKRPINVYSEEENKTTVHPVEDDFPIEEEPVYEDTLEFSIDTSNMPSISPVKDSVSTKKEIPSKEPEEKVKYEG